MEDEIFIAKYVADRFETEDLVKFADQKLTEGIYSEYFLRILDEDPQIWSPVSGYFELAVKELGYKIPTFDEAIWRLLKYHITLISKGDVSPSKQLREMLGDIERFDLHKDIKEYVGDNIGISRLYGWYHEDYCSIEETDSSIFEESIIWLHEYGSKH